MLPAPKARAGRAKMNRKASPRRLGYSFEDIISDVVRTYLLLPFCSRMKERAKGNVWEETIVENEYVTTREGALITTPARG